VPKPVPIVVLMQRLAAEQDPLGDSCQNSGLLKRVSLEVRIVPPGGVCSVGVLKALCAWLYMSPARRFESGKSLVPREQHQAMWLQHNYVCLC